MAMQLCLSLLTILGLRQSNRTPDIDDPNDINNDIDFNAATYSIDIDSRVGSLVIALTAHGTAWCATGHGAVGDFLKPHQSGLWGRPPPDTLVSRSLVSGGGSVMTCIFHFVTE